MDRLSLPSLEHWRRFDGGGERTTVGKQRQARVLERRNIKTIPRGQAEAVKSPFIYKHEEQEPNHPQSRHLAKTSGSLQPS